MNIIVTKAAARLAVLSVILSPPAFAKALDDTVSQGYFNDSLQRCNALLSHWESAWRIAVGLAVLVVILGAVSAVLQGIQAKSVRIATAICGLLVTIVTGLTNTVGWDHRVLNRSITKGEVMIAQMKRLKSLYGSPVIEDDDKRDALNEFGKLEIAFIQLHEPPEAVAQSNNFGYRIINTAHADQDAGPPSWVRAIPEDPKNLYFVGVADSAKLGDAKRTSKDNAIQNAASFLNATLSAKGGELDINKLTLSLAQVSEDAGNYVSFDQKNGIYKYYSLIRLNKDVAEARVNLFAVQHGIMPPAGLIKALRDTQRSRIEVQPKATKTALAEPEVRDWLALYRRAWESKNVDLLIQLGELTPDRGPQLRGILAGYDDLRVEVKDLTIRIDANSARVTFRREDTIDGRTVPHPGLEEVLLDKQANGHLTRRK